MNSKQEILQAIAGHLQESVALQSSTTTRIRNLPTCSPQWAEGPFEWLMTTHCGESCCS